MTHNYNFEKPKDVKSFINDLESIVQVENDTIKNFKTNIDTIFLDTNQKLEKHEYEKIVHNYYRSGSEQYEHEALIIINLIYDYYAEKDAFYVKPKDLKNYIDTYLKQTKTHSFQLDMTNHTAPLVATLYPDTSPQKLEIRKTTHTSIEVMTFNKKGQIIN